MRRRDFLGVGVAAIFGLLPKPRSKPELKPELKQEAIDAINDFTRMKMREDGFYRRFMPPLVVDESVELDRCIPTDKPVKVVDKEEAEPPTLPSIPFAVLPMSMYIRGPRYSPFLGDLRELARYVDG